jgi:hypothetical protein
LWQPVVFGKQSLQQFLHAEDCGADLRRRHQIGSALNSCATSSPAVKQLRSRATASRPGLGLDLEAADPCHRKDASLARSRSGRAGRTLGRRPRGFKHRKMLATPSAHAVSGPAFWQTQKSPSAGTRGDGTAAVADWPRSGAGAAMTAVDLALTFDCCGERLVGVLQPAVAASVGVLIVVGGRNTVSAAIGSSFARASLGRRNRRAALRLSWHGWRNFGPARSFETSGRYPRWMRATGVSGGQADAVRAVRRLHVISTWSARRPRGCHSVVQPLGTLGRDDRRRSSSTTAQLRRSGRSSPGARRRREP